MMHLIYDLRLADEPAVEETEPWSTLVDARELDPRFRMLPARLQEQCLDAHDRFLNGFAGRPAYHPARVDAGLLERWLVEEARDPVEAAALSKALNALLLKAVDLGFRPSALAISVQNPFGPAAGAPPCGRVLN